mmetsp:Transcript_20402/g.40407  ORF Transcript_20402/g.40407 Transcript_20402/m.40407 type:complete len:384 (-) Transcript_20402:234-1385(-)
MTMPSSQTQSPPQPSSSPTFAEHNKKWKAYLLLSTTSLVNFVSLIDVFDIPFQSLFRTPTYTQHSHINLMFGVVTFLTPLFILFFDFVSCLRNKFDFATLWDGKLEGYTLLVHVLWWTFGTAFMTKAGGIAYEALNVYFSSWASLFSSIHLLDLWGGEKDVLTIRELTRLSITLPAWWAVFWSSIVTFASAADAIRIVQTPSAKKSCEFAVAVGVISAIVSAFFILQHYEFLTCCCRCCEGFETMKWLSYGGWFELACSLLVNLWFIIGVDQLTSAGQISSTITGEGKSAFGILWDDEGKDGGDGDEVANFYYIPGTNIYMSIWIGFISSVLVTVRWKEARAIKFAETRREEGDRDVDVNVENVLDDEDGDKEEEEEEEDYNI